VSGGRLRKLHGLAVLLRPYRGRVWLMGVAMLLAVASSLVPP
jgi:ATP-binding cassette subfamily B protein